MRLPVPPVAVPEKVSEPLFRITPASRVALPEKVPAPLFVINEFAAVAVPVKESEVSAVICEKLADELPENEMAATSMKALSAVVVPLKLTLLLVAEPMMTALEAPPAVVKLSPAICAPPVRKKTGVVSGTLSFTMPLVSSVRIESAPAVDVTLNE